MPARIGALAYASGRDIALAPGEERQLPHEAWHIVQQRRGRVRATGTVGGMPLNDDPALEQEASRMGARAAAMRVAPPDVDVASAAQAPAEPAPVQAVVQRVRAGLEFTEQLPTKLHHYPPASVAGAAVNNTQVWSIGGQNVSAFTVPTGQVGAPVTADSTLIDQGYVEFTNDESSAEWVIKRHQADMPPSQLLSTMTNDIRTMFAMRKELASNVSALANPGEQVLLAPGNPAAPNLAPNVFTYKPAPTAKGSAQITVEYKNPETIKRINLQNTSAFLKGTKTESTQEIRRVASAEAPTQDQSFYNATALLNELTRTSRPVRNAAGGTFLQAEQVALVKLMLLNDAMGMTITRYKAAVGQANDKNAQGFFPKSRRDAYVTALGGTVDAAILTNLRAELNRTRNADASLLLSHVDAGSLPLGHAYERFAADDIARQRVDPLAVPIAPEISNNYARMHDANVWNRLNSQSTIKRLIFGDNDGLLLANMEFAIRAYTDTSNDATQSGHFRDIASDNPAAKTAPNVVSNVVAPVKGYTPAANDGAVYEYRKPEVPLDDGTKNWLFLGVDGSAKVIAALKELLYSA